MLQRLYTLLGFSAVLLLAVGCNKKEATPTVTSNKPVVAFAPPPPLNTPGSANIGDQTSGSVQVPGDSNPVDSTQKQLSHRDIIQKAETAILYVVARDATGEEIGSGTGFLVSAEGYAVTNHHVLQQAVSVKIQTRDGTELQVAGVVGSDPEHDIVLFQVADVPDSLAHLNLVDPGAIKQGEAVTAIGHPSGFQYTATNGIVSAVRSSRELPEEFQASLGAPETAVWIQTSAAISGGNSGGPLLDSFGNVIGMNTWIVQGRNLGFAIHVNHIMELLQRTSPDPSPFPLPGFGTVTDPEVAAMLEDFQNEYIVFARDQWSDEEESTLKKIFGGKEDPMAMYGEKLLELAKEKPNTSTAVQSLVNSAKLLSRSQNRKSQLKLLEAVRLLREEYLDDPWISEAAISLAGAPQDEVIEFQKAVIQNSPHRSAQGIACYALATNLQSRDMYLADSGFSGLGDSQPEYLALMERAVDQYGDVPLRGGTLKTVLGPALQMGQTNDGMVAPDIQGNDLFNKPLRLRDHLGKVVILDFWVDWCPYCRQMYPDNIKLMEKYKDEDFVLMGVNSDQQRGRALQAYRGYKMNYDSWNDVSGEITQAWGVDGFPTMVVLDKRGVIRHRMSTTDFDTLDKLVKSLLNEETSLLGSDIVKRGAEWRYYTGEEPPASEWMQRDFDTADWNSGSAPLGFGLGEATTLEHAQIGVPQPMSFYFRRDFEVSSSVLDVVVEGFFDDGIVLYVNGKEVARRSVPVQSDHSTAAVLERDGQGRTPTCFYVDKSLLKPGTNTIAAEVHQASEWSADLMFDLTVSSDVISKLRLALQSDSQEEVMAALRVARDIRSRARPLKREIAKHLEAKEEIVRLTAFSTLVAVDLKQGRKLEPPKMKKFKEIETRKAWAIAFNASSWDTAEVPGLSREDYLNSYHEALVATRLRPRDGMILNTQALTLARLGQQKMCLETLSAAKRIHGKKPADYLVASLAFHQLGKSDRAKAAYNAAMKMLEEITNPEQRQGFDGLQQETAKLFGDGE